MKNSKKFSTATRTAILVTASATLIALGTAITKVYALNSPDNNTGAKDNITRVEPDNNTQQQKMDLEKFFKIYGTPISIFGAMFTYIVNERWKRRQYAEEKIKDFENQLETINVRKMLNTELQCVELFPFLDEPTHRYVVVDDVLWAEALLECKCNKHLNEQHKSIDKEKPLYQQPPAVKIAIRDNFNRFLHHLQQFEKMIESGVVNKQTLSNYLNPWFEFINRANHKDSITCPISKRKYTSKEALLEYIEISTINIPDEKISIIQKDVRALIKRYRSLDFFYNEK